MQNKLGWVVIGRNEGQRLVKCFQSIEATQKVYVDSGSIDQSVCHASTNNFAVVDLDTSLPFSAARARNAGWQCLLNDHPSICYIMFVDGDCEVNESWAKVATEYLDKNRNIGVVFGRLRERAPNLSIYNAMCDTEWDTPVGEALASGGNAVIRVEALVKVGGYRQDMIAGEEPEMCFRMRQEGFKVWRLPDEMAWHDSAMTRFWQWWMRSKRSGYAFAHGFWLHRAGSETLWRKETIRAAVWGVLLPCLGVFAVGIFGSYGLSVFLIYPVQYLRLYLRIRAATSLATTRAFFMTLIRLPEALGVMKFVSDLVLKRRSSLIEHK
jgi:GT2 family glycosyltransferase